MDNYLVAQMCCNRIRVGFHERGTPLRTHTVCILYQYA